MRELVFKPDFSRTVARFEAWWRREILDRPPCTFVVAGARRPALPAKRHATLRDRWLDVEFTVDSAVARMEASVFLGDSLPIFWGNLGPEITATLFGCALDCSEHTSWSSPVVHAPEDWERIATAGPDFGNLYWQTMERMTAYALGRCEGRYLVGMTDLHGTYDMLAGLRDPQMLCVDLLDNPELVDRAARNVAAASVEAFRRQYRQVSAAGFGSTCWTPFYHDGPAYVPSCDFWCLVSEALAREMIFPTIAQEIVPLARSIFHLDGPQALRHLELMLELPGLTAVQWVYGAGQGPASRWIDVYRRCQAGGKAIQLIARDASDALDCLKQLDPHGVWITLDEGFRTRDEAETFLQELSRK